MPLTRYLLQRLLFALALVFAASSAALVLTLLPPSGCAAPATLDDDSRAACEERIALGLERPVAVQYVEWLTRAVRLDFGRSLLYTRPVTELIGDRAGNTAVLAAAALGMATVTGIPLGIYTAARRRGVGVAAVRAGSLLLLSTPPLLAVLALVVFAARTGWVPAGGMTSAGATAVGWGAWLLDVARHVPLPACALALPLAAVLERLQSQALTETARAPFVQAARARGLSPHRAVLRHAWPASLRGVLGLYGVIIGSLFSGSFIVEIVTAWPGLGRLMYDALRARDLHLVVGCAATSAAFLATATLLSDLLLASVDPRTLAEV